MLAVKSAIAADYDRVVSVLIKWDGSKIVLVAVSRCNNNHRIRNDIQDWSLVGDDEFLSSCASWPIEK